VINYYSSGVAKELLTLAIKQLCRESGVLQPTSNGCAAWFCNQFDVIRQSPFIRRGETYKFKKKDTKKRNGVDESGADEFMSGEFIETMKTLVQFTSSTLEKVDLYYQHDSFRFPNHASNVRIPQLQSLLKRQKTEATVG